MLQLADAINCGRFPEWRQNRGSAPEHSSTPRGSADTSVIPTTFFCVPVVIVVAPVIVIPMIICVPAFVSMPHLRAAHHHVSDRHPMTAGEIKDRVATQRLPSLPSPPAPEKHSSAALNSVGALRGALGKLKTLDRYECPLRVDGLAPSARSVREKSINTIDSCSLPEQSQFRSSIGCSLFASLRFMLNQRWASSVDVETTPLPVHDQPPIPF